MAEDTGSDEGLPDEPHAEAELGEPAEQVEPSVGEDETPTRPWYRHPYLAIGLIGAGVALAAFGVTRFAAASSENSREDEALEQLADLDDRLARLEADTAEVRTDIAAIEDDTAATRGATAAAEDDIVGLDAAIEEAEQPVRQLQEEVWDIYAAFGRVVELEGRLTDSLEGAVQSGNERDVDTMVNQVETAESGLLADLEDAVGALDRAIADAEALMVEADTDIEITEDFEGPVDGWEAGFASNGVAGPAEGGYLVTADDEGYLMWGLSPYRLADATVTVAAEPVEGDDRGTFAYGVMCRAEQADSLVGYWFAVTGEGAYQAGWFGPDSEYNDLLDPAREDRPADATGLSAAVNRGLNENVLSVTCNGPDLSFSVNGVVVWEGTDDSLTDGRIALAAYPFGDEAVTVRFDDLTLTAAGQPEGDGS